MILDQLIEQPMQGNAHEAINDIISQNSRATQAFFPQGQFLGMEVPKYSGDVIEFLLGMGAGKAGLKGGNIILDELKRAGARRNMAKAATGLRQTGLKSPNTINPSMLNELTKKKGTYYPPPGYKPQMGKSMEYAPGVNIARDPSTWTKEGERIIQQLLDMGIDIINK